MFYAYIYASMFTILFIMLCLCCALFLLVRIPRKVIFKVMTILRFMNKLSNVFTNKLKVYRNAISLVYDEKNSIHYIIPTKDSYYF